MKLKLFLLLIIYNLSFCIVATATIRYVSKKGSATPPYTSWATAGDSIKKVVGICANGDTIVVANGTYNESIYIDKTINLWGSSADSTIIDGSGTPNNYILYFFGNNSNGNNSTLKNFKIISPLQNKTGIANWETTLQAENCILDGIYLSLNIVDSSPLIENFIIKNATAYNLREECPNDTCKGIFRDNIILAQNSPETPVKFNFGGYPTFNNNILIGNSVEGLHGGYLRGIHIKNNLISGFRWYGIVFGDIRIDTAYTINNNVVYIEERNHPEIAAISTGTGHRTQIKNNIIKNTSYGIASFNDSVKGDYNLFWNVKNKVGSNAYLGDSNIVADPMFVNDTIPTSATNFDFHLQKYSPAIDKGDPNIRDKNGSRSDIGMFGGPSGESYKYLDLPPKTPRNFSYSFDTNHTLLTLNGI